MNRIPSITGASGGCGIVLGLIFAASGAIPIGLVMMGPVPNWGLVAGMSILVLIGAAMVLFGLVHVMSAAKHNPVFFELAAPPRVGSELVGHVEAAFSSTPTSPAKCVLECTVTTRRPGARKSHSHTERLLSTAFEVSPSAMTHTAGRLHIPVRVPLPPTVPPTGPGMDSSGRTGSVRWSFQCTVEGPGVDFRSMFPLTMTA